VSVVTVELNCFLHIGYCIPLCCWF